MSKKFIISEIQQLPTLNYVAENADDLGNTELYNELNAINRTYLESIGVDMGTTICDLMSQGHTIKKICAQIGLPSVMLVKWLKENHKEQWDEANEIRANDLIEEAVQDIDNTNDENIFVDRAKATIKLKAAQLKKPVRQEIEITTPMNAGVIFVQANKSNEVIDVTPVNVQYD